MVSMPAVVQIIVKPSKTPRVDGSLDDEWKNEKFVEFSIHFLEFLLPYFTEVCNNRSLQQSNSQTEHDKSN